MCNHIYARACHVLYLFQCLDKIFELCRLLFVDSLHICNDFLDAVITKIIHSNNRSSYYFIERVIFRLSNYVRILRYDFSPL